VQNIPQHHADVHDNSAHQGTSEPPRLDPLAVGPMSVAQLQATTPRSGGHLAHGRRQAPHGNGTGKERGEEVAVEEQLQSPHAGLAREHAWAHRVWWSQGKSWRPAVFAITSIWRRHHEEGGVDDRFLQENGSGVNIPRGAGGMVKIG
jgi:hypothetical protein